MPFKSNALKRKMTSISHSVYAKVPPSSSGFLPMGRISSYQDKRQEPEEDTELLNYEEAEVRLRKFFPEGTIEKYFSTNRLIDKNEGLKIMTNTMFE
jgi:hypothetical protein